MYTFADVTQKLYLDHLKKDSTIEEFEDACLELLKYRRECQSKRNEALWNAKLQLVTKGADEMASKTKLEILKEFYDDADDFARRMSDFRDFDKECGRAINKLMEVIFLQLDMVKEKISQEEDHLQPFDVTNFKDIGLNKEKLSKILKILKGDENE